MHEVIVGVEGVTFQLAHDLTYALPLLCLFGIAVQIWPSRFGVLGSPGALRYWAAGMVAVWMLAAVNVLLLYYVWKYHSRLEGFGFFFLVGYLGPSMVLSLVSLVIRHKMQGSKKENG
ncbi:hypothetical protein [Achromobacter anxifer]